MKIAILGAGLIGKERIIAIQELSKYQSDIELISVYDPIEKIRQDVESRFSVKTVSDIEDVFKSKPDWIFIATPNDVIKDLIKKSFDCGANVLVEKPFGRTYNECNDILQLKPNNKKLHIGFNYRFFAGIESAINDIKSGKFGKIISVNMILAHGNSPGMEKSWKLDPVRCGGCISDLGVHLFDITLQIATGNVKIVSANSWKGFWNTGIDEENHWIAKDDEGVVFNCQTSLNRWKSNFRLEINGTEGYGIVMNRGRSYGPQSYIVGKRWAWVNGGSQADHENVIVNKDPCTDSFIKETCSVLDLNIEKYKSNLKSCDHVGAKNIMYLLNNYMLEEKKNG